MHKSMKRQISMLIVMVLILTTTVIPAQAASVSCMYCGSSTRHYGESYEVTEYYIVCDNAPNYVHLHQDIHYFDDYICTSCGRMTSVYLDTKPYCSRGNMAKSDTP